METKWFEGKQVNPSEVDSIEDAEVHDLQDREIENDSDSEVNESYERELEECLKNDEKLRYLNEPQTKVILKTFVQYISF